MSDGIVVVSRETFDHLRKCFDTWLIAEMNEHEGIPELPPEEAALRDAVATLLEEGGE